MTKYLVKTGWKQPDPRVNAIPQFEIHAKPPEAKRYGQLYDADGKAEVYASQEVAAARLRSLKAHQVALAAQAEFERLAVGQPETGPEPGTLAMAAPPDPAEID